VRTRFPLWTTGITLQRAWEYESWRGRIGFETKIMRQVVRLRKMEAHDREEQEQLLDLYKRAVGMVG
jgi:uncharacterized protein (UPF0335 family)